MQFTRTNIPDVVIIEPNVHGDDRGYFVETFRQDKLEEFLGYKINFCQDNESKSSKGVLRGLHYSPTFGKHVAVELTSENKKQLLVPRGFAHGFIVLEDDTTFAYKVDNYYSPPNDRGIAFDDKDLDINWMLNTNELNLSDKDKVQPLLKETRDIFKYEVNYYND